MTKIINKVNVSFPWALILFVVLLILKLANVVDWSWWIITLPLWVGIPLVLLIAVGALIFVGVAMLIEKWK
tara:strand:- start:38914 stop:39126 length:213 start_codon:yes stop_codon:yes gene_type:complete